MPTISRPDGASRSEERHPRRPFDRRRRGHALIGAHGESRVAKAVLISSVPPLMVKTPANPGGLPKEVFDGLQVQVADQPRAVLPRPAGRPVLRLQSAGRETSQGDHPELVAARHDGRRQGALRRRRRVFADRLHRDLKKITVPCWSCTATTIRSSLRRLRPAVGEAGAERNPEDLSRASRTACRPPTRRQSMPTCWRSSRPSGPDAGALRAVVFMTGIALPPIWQISAL